MCACVTCVCVHMYDCIDKWPTLQVNEREPQVMWLSGLHIPESYLTALVQATCRKNSWPLDRSTLYTAVTEVRLVAQWAHVCE